jgi:hypothetical protein
MSTLAIIGAIILLLVIYGVTSKRWAAAIVVSVCALITTFIVACGPANCGSGNSPCPNDISNYNNNRDNSWDYKP